jgi:hypothetical protein
LDGSLAAAETVLDVSQAFVKWLLREALETSLKLILPTVVFLIIRRFWRRPLRRLLEAVGLWRVRLRSLHVATQGPDGTLQPGPRIGPDATRLLLHAALALPRGGGAYPIEVRLRLAGPDGARHADVCRTIDSPDAWTGSLVVVLSDLSELRRRPGPWRGEVVDARGRVLGRVDFEVVAGTAAADVEAEDLWLVLVRNGQSYRHDLVFDDTAMVLPQATLRARGSAAARLQGKKVRVELVSQETGTALDTVAVPLRLEAGVMRLDFLSYPVAGAALAGRPGGWAFRLSVDGCLLGELPFAVVTREQARQSVRVERFDLFAGRTGGEADLHLVGRQADASWTRFLVPVLGLRTCHASPALAYGLTVAVLRDGEPYQLLEKAIVLPQEEATVTVGEIKAPVPAAEGQAVELEIMVLLDGRYLAGRMVVVRVVPPADGDAEGRLVDLGNDEDGIDFVAEAARLLEPAKAAP